MPHCAACEGQCLGTPFVLLRNRLDMLWTKYPAAVTPQGIPPQEVATAGGDSYQQKGYFIINTSKENWRIVPNTNMSRLTRTDPGGPLDQRMEAGETKGNCSYLPPPRDLSAGAWLQDGLVWAKI